MARILARLELRQVLARALAIGFFVCVPLAPSAAQPAGVARPAIAVLPLKNASGDADQDFFADGITDEIAVALTKVPGLDVVARSSIFRFKEQNHDIAAIGKAVKARYLLDGSARKVDTRVRISAKLIRVPTAEMRNCGRKIMTPISPTSSMSKAISRRRSPPLCACRPVSSQARSWCATAPRISTPIRIFCARRSWRAPAAPSRSPMPRWCWKRSSRANPIMRRPRRCSPMIMR